MNLAVRPVFGPAARPSPFTIDTVSDYAVLAGMSEVWAGVYDAAGLDSPFLTHDWLLSWWEAFGKRSRLHVVVVKSGARPVAIAPLMWSTERMLGLKVRSLRCIYNDHTPRLDFIVAADPQGVYATIWDHIVALQSSWSVLELNQLVNDSSTLSYICRHAERSGMRWGEWNSSESPFLPLEGGWEGYQQSLNAKNRSNLRNRGKRLRQLGSVSYDTVTSGANLAQALEDGFRIEAAAWKGENGTAINCRPELRQFYMSVARRFAGRGLRLDFLRVGDRPIAFAYSLCYKSKFYLLKTGYDPRFSAYAPFKLLCDHLIKSAFEDGLHEFDFLGDSMPWKLEWTRQHRSHRWLYIFGNSPLCRFLYEAKFRWMPHLRAHPLVQRARKRLQSGNGATSR